ncbi:23S rRNA (pseudouridine(1915)-N(3))-methyltransferase RlmH [bacterium]|nr:MAG: 23S rRNA (pseudouridine(1915)-N(3))-methyltransferase RlmH [bacterium]
MKIIFISVGKAKKPYFKDAAEHYMKRIKSYCRFERVEVKEETYNAGVPLQELLKKEAGRIIGAIGNGVFSVALSENGKQMTSRALAGFIHEFMAGGRSGKKDIAFIVGGPYGLHASVLEVSDMALSLSAMTLPHDMAGVMLAEQVYRAFTIIKGEPYSH